MKAAPLFALLVGIVFSHLLGLASEVRAQDEDRALTYDYYPSYFSASHPFKPNSPLLLHFNASVNPDAVEGSFKLYDKTNERFASIVASRPTEEDQKRASFDPTTEVPLEQLVLIRPVSPLPLDSEWYLHASAGLTSADGAYAIIESRLDYLAQLESFRVSEIEAINNFDSEKQITIFFNKEGLAKEFTSPEKLRDYVTVTPAPKDLKLRHHDDELSLKGEFDYGVDYEVTVRDGLIALDTTQLTQLKRKTVSFTPNPGFIAYPTFAKAQNASGHRKFEVKFGNLTGLRTRVKALEGKDLIVAMRDYNEKYEGWGDEQTLAFESVPGRTVYDQFHDSNGEVDVSTQIVLDWNEISKGTTTGAFYLCSEGDSSTRSDHAVGAQSLIQLTDIGITWKQGEGSSLIYAFSLKSGTPLAETKITLRDEAGAALTETLTDASGIARLDAKFYKGKDETFFLDAVTGQDRHLLRFHLGPGNMGVWNFGLSQRWDEVTAGERRTLIFTDRDIYRPGDEVKLKAISRFVDADQLIGAGKGKARLRLFDGRHRKLIDREIAFSDRGSFDDSFTLPSEGMGWHSIEIDFNTSVQESEHDWRLVESYSFQVEDYRVNTFEVTVDAKEDYEGGGELHIPVSARYFMGKPLSKAELNWVAYASSEFPRPRGFDEFHFGNQLVDEEVFDATGTAALSSQGEANANFTLPEQTINPGPRQVRLTASVTDANQQTLSGSKRFTVHSSDFYLGLREPEGVYRAGDSAPFAIAAVTTEGQAYTEAVETFILVEKEEWNTVKVMGANGKMVHRSQMQPRTISDERLILKTKVDAATGLTKAVPHNLTFAEAGDYQITLTARDAKDRHVITKISFTVIGVEEPAWSWYDVIRIDLIPDKEQYRVGDTAKLLARSPLFGNALFTVERGGVREVRTLVIDQYETILEVPIEEGAAPNLFASLLIIRGSDDSPHLHKVADHRLGYCELIVDDPAAKLSATVSAGEAEYYRPGEEVEFTATVLDAEKRPVSGAEVTFYAVDEGVLSLTGYETPQPESTFYAPFPLAVWTEQSLSDLFPENPLEQDFGNKGYVIGGGGGGFGIDPERIRKDFKALAFWEASLITDENGIVRAKAIAPDNLTTFRVIAVVAEGNRFGSGETPLVINKPLIIEPALPGFTNLTDQIDVAAVLHNNSGAEQEVEVTVTLDPHALFLDAIGETIPTALTAGDAPSTRSVKRSLAPGATETVSFPIAMTATGEAVWNWQVRSLSDESLSDAVESKIAVGYPLPLLRETHSLALHDGADLANALQDVTPRLLNGEGHLTVHLSNSRLIEATDGLDYLLNYPYGCLEQITSTLIPWLNAQSLYPFLPKLEKTEEEIKATISETIARIFIMQTNDGGLGYWPGRSESMLWGSAYAGVAIAMAQRQGIEIPADQAQALWDYLSLQLRGSAELKKPYDLSQRCLAAYALALAGQGEEAYHEVLFERHKQLSAEARALLALAMIESGSSQNQRIESLLSPDPKVPVAEVSWYRQPYIAATRLLAQVRHNPKSTAIDGLVDDLMKLRLPRDGWGSTYSNSWPFIALAAYSKTEAAALSANQVEIRFGDRSETVELSDQPSSHEISFDFEGSVSDRPLSIHTKEQGPIFANLTVATRPAIVPVEPENQGFSIHRRYEKVEIDGSIVPAENLLVGDLILVTLDLNFPNERESYLAIDDALPAIFEAVNPSFKTNETQRVNAKRTARTFYANHTEIHKDRVLFFADSLYGAGDYSLQYLARVVAPGEVTAPPAKIEAMYEPQRFGLSGTERISAAARPLESGKVATNP